MALTGKTDENVGIYIKIGRRYRKLENNELARLYTCGYPRNGIWRIKDNSSEWVGENPTPEHIEAFELKDVILKGLTEADVFRRRNGISNNDIANFIIKQIETYYKGSSG